MIRPLDASVIARCELPLTARPGAARPGMHSSRRPGPGDDVNASRTYIPGDDVRRIDWKASARLNELQTRTTFADVSVNVHLIPSGSPAMNFGTVTRKHDQVARALGGVATIAARRSDQVFLHTRPTVSLRLPGRHVLSHLDLHMPTPGWAGRDFTGETVERMGRAQVPSLLVCAVDLFAPPGLLEVLRRSSRERDILVVLIHDPAELELPAAGRLALVDPVSGKRVLADTTDAKLRRRYAEAAASRRERMLTELAGARVLEISTAEEVEVAFDRTFTAQR